jgi:hypothetical protein
MERWSTGITPLLVGLLLLNRFYVISIAHLASIPHSGGDPKLRQNVSLKRHPNDNEQNKPQDSHIFSLREFLFHKTTRKASSSARPLSMTSGKAAMRGARV